MTLVAESCHACGMPRVRISTTVDEETLTAARALGFANDSEVIDAALTALVRARRKAEIDASYEVYDRIPLNTPDEWGDLESFMAAVDRMKGRYSVGEDPWLGETPER